MIRALIFDCFGVLYRDNLSMLYDIVPHEKQHDLQDIIHATDHGFLSREEYYESVAELAGSSPADIREIEKRQHSRDETMISYTQSFKPEYKIGLLSNIDTDSMDRLFPEPERSQLFDTFIISGEVGATKPAIQMFNIAAERLQLQPEECLMIDDIPANLDGARAAGMQAILFTSKRQLENDLKIVLGSDNA